MARRCGCASDQCSCEIVGGEGIIVTGAGSPRNPYKVTSTVAQIETGFDVQYNNVDIIHDVHQIDFRGSAVTVTPGTDEIVVTVNQPDPVSGYTVPSGAMWMFGGATAPSGWLLCDGTTKLVADYPDLFAAIGNRYGGDGTVNFKVPNMGGHFPIGASAGTPANEVGGGSASKTLGAANVPPHTHGMSHNHPSWSTYGAGNHDHATKIADADGNNANLTRKGGGNWFTGRDQIDDDGNHTHNFDIPHFYGNTDGGAGLAGAGFDIMPPWIGVSFIIKS